MKTTKVKQPKEIKPKLVPVKYWVAKDVYLENRDPENRFPGRDSWSIVVNGFCVNKLGKREWEPLPSSRSEAFLKRNRFSLQAAEVKAREYLQGENQCTQ